MTLQGVSENEKTLKQVIEDGDIEPPPLMEWNAWQKWRRDVGMRPSQRVDESTTSNTEEAALWKRTMADRYGDDWSMQLMTRVAETDAPVEGEVTVQPGTVPSAEPANASAPQAQPPPTDTERLTTPCRGQTEVSRGIPRVGSTVSWIILGKRIPRNARIDAGSIGNGIQSG